MAKRGNRQGPGTETRIREHVARELEWYLQVLRGLVDASGRSEAEIEARLDWPPSHLRRLFSEPQELRYGDVFAILAAIGVEPRRYFDLVTSRKTEH